MRAGAKPGSSIARRRELVAPDGGIFLRRSHLHPGFDRDLHGMENHPADGQHNCSESESSHSAFKPNRSGFDLRSSQWQRPSSVFVNRSSDFENPSSGVAGSSSVAKGRSSELKSRSSGLEQVSSEFKTRSSPSVTGSSVLAGAPSNHKRLLRFQKLLLRLCKKPHHFIKLLSHSSLMALRREFTSIRLYLPGICFGGENTPVPMPFAPPIK